jgi:hypothetical protein
MASQEAMYPPETMVSLCPAYDFHVEPDDTTRGITLDAAGLVCHVDETKSRGERLECEVHEPTMFLERDQAPVVPEDPCFALELTTITSLKMSAAQAANSVLHFLNEAVTSRITKVSWRKFTIKAEIVIDNMNCEVKARVYTQASGNPCVEMQRRNGDTIAFNRFYQCLSQHMKS